MILYGLVEKKMGVLKKYLLTCQGGLHRNSLKFFSEIQWEKSGGVFCYTKKRSLKTFLTETPPLDV